jgi:hypothetical protein
VIIKIRSYGINPENLDFKKCTIAKSKQSSLISIFNNTDSTTLTQQYNKKIGSYAQMGKILE